MNTWRLMHRPALVAALVLSLGAIFSLTRAQAQAYPVLHTRYEAIDQRAGGHFIIWLEREKIYRGLDPRLYPAVRYVDVIHITPSPGSPIISLIEVMPVNSNTSEYYHIAGIVRFKVTGMRVSSSSIPPQ